MIHLYLRSAPEPDRYLPGDHYLISLLRKLFRPKRISSIEKVFIHLTKGFDELQIQYDVNLPFNKIKPGEPVVVLGNGKYALQGYKATNPVIAGIALMTHPSEWPGLCLEYPVARYLQHADWTRNIYVPYYGPETCALWPAGIETDKWKPHPVKKKEYDILIYTKIMWPDEPGARQLLTSVTGEIRKKGLRYKEIIYGHYQEDQYFDLLNESSAMIYLCEHESQGLACCEALAMDVPVFAWDQGIWLDPNRRDWKELEPVFATSVPFFDKRCGKKFVDFAAFSSGFDDFWQNVQNNVYQPRDYIMENLTLKKSAQQMIDIINSVYP